MKFLAKLFSPQPSNYGRTYDFTVRCKRCGETISNQINLSNEPSLEFDENGKSFYLCRKVLIGPGPCFQQIEAIFKFNEQRGLLERQISGGEFVDD